MHSRVDNSDMVVTPRTESARALRTPRSRHDDRTPGADSLTDETRTVKAFTFDLPASAARLSESAHRRHQSPSWRELASTSPRRPSAYRDEVRESREQAQRFRLVRGLLEAQEDGARFCLLLEQLLSYRELSRREFEARLRLLPREEADRLRTAREVESRRRQEHEREVWDVEEIVRRANKAHQREEEARAALDKATQQQQQQASAVAAAPAETPAEPRRAERERVSGRHESAHRRYPRRVEDTPPEPPRPTTSAVGTSVSPPPRPTKDLALSPHDRDLVDSTPHRVAARRLSDSSNHTEAASVSFHDLHGRQPHHKGAVAAAAAPQGRESRTMIDAAPVWSEVMALQEAIARLHVRMMRLEDGDVLSALVSLRRRVCELEHQTEAVEKTRGITW